jgi:hypothetical protein
LGSRFSAAASAVIDEDFVRTPKLVQNKGIGKSADNLWRRVGAFLPTSGQHEPTKELPAVSEGNGADIPSFPLPSGADHATTPVCDFAGNHADELTDFAVQLPLF